MSLSNATEVDILRMMLKRIDPSWRAAANAYVALHTADPGETGTAISNECAYVSYTRSVCVKDDFWTEDGSTFGNAEITQFPVCDGGIETATHWSIVTTASGAGQIIISAPLASPLAISNGVRPEFAIGDLLVAAD